MEKRWGFKFKNDDEKEKLLFLFWVKRDESALCFHNIILPCFIHHPIPV
jgi:hypothetical protein